MKKIIASVLSLACVLGLVGCNTKDNEVVGNEVVEDFVGIVTSVNDSDTSYVVRVTDSGSSQLEVGDMVAVQTVDKSSPEHSVNDYIKVDFNGAVEETSANKSISRVFAIEKAFDIAVSYANWTEASEVYFGALNKDTMAISSVQHLPIYKFDTLEDLEQFKLTFGEVLAMDSGYDGVPSFNDTTANYDETFFDENTLMLVYVGANNCTHRYWVNSIFCNGTSFCIHVEETTGAEGVDTAMAGWFLTVAIPDSMVENCTEFDADLNNNFD